MAKSTTVLTRVAALPLLLVAYAFERLIDRIQGRRAWLDPAEFPWTRELEASCPRIQAELAEVLSGDEYIPEFREVSVELAQNITTGTSWKSFFFHAYGRRYDRNCDRCPETAKLVEGIPGMKTAFFSILAPGTHITPHRGPFKGVLRLHLPLVVPRDAEKCGIRVGDEVRHWEAGRSFVFDDTFEHEAWNESDEARVVLFVDFARQLPGPLGALNRGLLRMIGASPFIRNIFCNLDAMEAAKAQEPAAEAR